MQDLRWLMARYRDRQSKIIIFLEFLIDRDAYRFRLWMEGRVHDMVRY